MIEISRLSAILRKICEVVCGYSDIQCSNIALYLLDLVLLDLEHSPFYLSLKTLRSNVVYCDSMHNIHVLCIYHEIYHLGQYWCVNLKCAFHNHYIH